MIRRIKEADRRSGRMRGTDKAQRGAAVLLNTPSPSTQQRRARQPHVTTGPARPAPESSPHDQLPRAILSKSALPFAMQGRMPGPHEPSQTKKKTGMTKIERVRSMTQGAPIAVLRDLGRRESFKSVKPHRASDPRPNRHILPGRSPTSMPPQRPTRPADFWRRRRLSTTISRAVSTPRLASFFAFSEASPFQPSQLRGVELLQHYLAWRGARCTM